MQLGGLAGLTALTMGIDQEGSTGETKESPVPSLPSGMNGLSPANGVGPAVGAAV